MLAAHKFKLSAKNERKTKTLKLNPKSGGGNVFIEKKISSYKFDWEPCKDQIQSLKYSNEQKNQGKKNETSIVVIYTIVYSVHKAL